jgi:hypothetical protein
MSAMTDPASLPPTPPPEPAPAPPSAWQPPSRRASNLPPIIVGLIILGIGVWYFLDTTLGLAMPRISWGDLWPLLLIGVGGLILFRAATDRRR